MANKPQLSIYLSDKDKKKVERIVSDFEDYDVKRQELLLAAFTIGLALIKDVAKKDLKEGGLAGSLLVDGRRIAAAMMGFGVTHRLTEKFLPSSSKIVDLQVAREEWEAI